MVNEMVNEQFMTTVSCVVDVSYECWTLFLSPHWCPCLKHSGCWYHSLTPGSNPWSHSSWLEGAPQSKTFAPKTSDQKETDKTEGKIILVLQSNKRNGRNFCKNSMLFTICSKYNLLSKHCWSKLCLCSWCAGSFSSKGHTSLRTV